jgi:putative transposase
VFENVLSIDLGVNNLATCVSNIEKPFIICGKKFTAKSLDKFRNKQKNKINDFLHKTSSKIVKYCLDKNISKAIIGDITGIQDKTNLGKKTNQVICNIPFGQLFLQLEYKLKKYNINFSKRKESYTLKASFIDNDFFPENHKPNERFNFSGKRIKRGLYKSLESILINADVNGALNILRKSNPKFNIDFFKSVLKYSLVERFTPIFKCCF